MSKIVGFHAKSALQAQGGDLLKRELLRAAAAVMIGLNGRLVSTTAIALSLIPLLIATIGARATLLKFDDLSGPYTAIPNGYGGLNWSDWWLLNVPGYCAAGYCPSGYQQAVISQPNVAVEALDPFSGGLATSTFSSSTPFTLDSFYITAAWRDDLTVTVTGYNGDTQIHQSIFTVGTQSAGFEIFNWTGLTSVSLTPSGGTPHGYGASDYEVAIDSMTINGSVVLEPAPWVMMLVGFAGLGYAGFRRRSAVAAAL
jgi:hypothetical protein